jgi:hypothetical protein
LAVSQVLLHIISSYAPAINVEHKVPYCRQDENADILRSILEEANRAAAVAAAARSQEGASVGGTPAAAVADTALVNRCLVMLLQGQSGQCSLNQMPHMFCSLSICRRKAQMSTQCLTCEAAGLVRPAATAMPGGGPRVHHVGLKGPALILCARWVGGWC